MHCGFGAQTPDGFSAAELSAEDREKFDKIMIGGYMKDPRISIRLSEEEHAKFKMLAIKKKKSMQDLLVGYVRREIKKEEVKSNEKAN